MEVLGRRQRVLGARGRAGRGALGAAVLGAAAALVLAELETWGPCQFGGCRFMLELLLTASTLALLLLLLLYRGRGLQLAMLDAGTRDWRVVFGVREALWTLLELGFCSLQPLPRPPPWWGDPCPPRTPQDPQNTPPGDPWRLVLTLGVVARVLWVLPKGLWGGSGVLRGLGGLGGVGVGGGFAFRAFLGRRPAATLVGVVAAAWVLGAWVLALSERDALGARWPLSAGLWLLPVTFLTLGYGDLVPLGACGRGLCLLTGAMGLFCSALLVALLSQRLELRRGERALLGVLRAQRGQVQVRQQAARVLQAAWRLHRQGGWRAERGLLVAIEGFRSARLRFRQLKEELEGGATLEKVLSVLQELQQRLGALEQRLELLGGGVGPPSHPATPSPSRPRPLPH